MKEQLQLKNHLKEVRTEANLSQAQLAEMVGVSRNTISSIETGQFNPTAKLALILCIALDKKFEVIIPGLSEPPVRTLRATIPENESHIFR